MVHPMTRSPLADAFAHHVWATLRVIDACLPLVTGRIGPELARGTPLAMTDSYRPVIGRSCQAGQRTGTNKRRTPPLVARCGNSGHPLAVSYRPR
jgi:hypothetical protein